MLYGTGKYSYELADGWAKCPEGFSFQNAPGIVVDSQDRVHVFSRSEHPVAVFDLEGNLLSWWEGGLSAGLHGCCIDPEGSIYCTDTRHHTVTKYTPDGKVLLTLGNKDQPSDTGWEPKPGATGMDGLNLESIKRAGPPFNRPCGVAVSSSGEIYVADGYSNARVHKFAPDGTLLLSWGEPGHGPGQFWLSHWCWVDKQEHVWICDRQNNRIQIFNSEGKFLDQWTGFSLPASLTIDEKEGVVYVAEIGRQVSVLTIEGKLLARWGEGTYVYQKSEDGKEGDTPSLFLAPHGIAVDSRGDIYVGEIASGVGGIDRGARTVQKFIRKA